MPKLTVPTIGKYKPNGVRREIPDSQAPNLYLIIQPSGRRSWALRFRRPNGKTAKLTLGGVDMSENEPDDAAVIGGVLTLGQARELAAKIDRQRAKGIDVVEEQKAERSREMTAAAERAANTFGACLPEFFADYKTEKWKARPRHWREDAALLGLRYAIGADPTVDAPSVIKGGLADIWHDKPVTGIDGHDVHAVVAETRRRADSRARKFYSALSVFFGWLLQQRRVATNPCAGVYHPGPPTDRERKLSDDEIVIFWRACDVIGKPYGALFKMLLLTGCRLEEASEMTRGELEGDVWTVPSNRTKNHRPMSLPLPSLATDIINGMPVIGEKGFVFTAKGKRGVSTFSRAKREIDAAMAKIAGQPIPDWRLHDLRRTFVSGLAALGVQLPVIERLVNHLSGSFGGVAGVYQRHEFTDEKREALRRWAQHLIGLTEPESRKKVVSLKSGRRK